MEAQKNLPSLVWFRKRARCRCRRHCRSVHLSCNKCLLLPVWQVEAFRPGLHWIYWSFLRTCKSGWRIRLQFTPGNQRTPLAFWVLIPIFSHNCLCSSRNQTWVVLAMVDKTSSWPRLSHLWRNRAATDPESFSYVLASIFLALIIYNNFFCYKRGFGVLG